MRTRNLILAGFLLAAPAAVLSLPWDTDMYDTQVYKAQRGGSRQPAENTVPVNNPQYVPPMAMLADGITSPTGNSPESAERGKPLFNTYCVTCHGVSAKGDGPVTQRGMLAIDLTDPYRKSLSDGRVWATILNGSVSQLMPQYREGMSPEEAWDVVSYLRQLQQQP